MQTPMSTHNYLSTQHLTLREFTAQDKKNLEHFRDDPSQLQYMMLYIETDEQIDEFLNYAVAQTLAEKPQSYNYALELSETGEFIGGVDLMIDHDAPSSAELGYWLKRDHWGKGYALEASLALISFGFKELGLHRIWGKCHVDNKGSARVMEKCGMKYEGCIREHVVLRDKFRSSHLYSILEHEFQV